MASETSLKYFNDNAPDWDNMRTAFFSESVREASIAKAWLRPEMAAADIGGGTGFITAGIAPLVREVHLVDQSSSMIEIAQQKLSSFTNIRYN
jgi:ubiquinone/menaquinone biosynthesis C-methylase UbiE